MYTSIIKAISFAALIGISSVQGAEIVVNNKCASGITVGSLTNGKPDANIVEVPQGGSKTFTHPEKWEGRYWARNKCAGDKCKELAGAANPASLAEIKFLGDGDQDFYDVSFVDGFNLPMSIAPINPSDPAKDHRCTVPKCAKVPSCPEPMKVFNDANELVGCKSACSQFNTDEVCCRNQFDSVEACPPNDYSKPVKEACPDVYTFAHDDQTSTYTCKASGYTITFCP